MAYKGTAKRTVTLFATVAGWTRTGNPRRRPPPSAPATCRRLRRRCWRWLIINGDAESVAARSVAEARTLKCCCAWWVGWRGNCKGGPSQILATAGRRSSVVSVVTLLPPRATAPRDFAIGLLIKSESEHRCCCSAREACPRKINGHSFFIIMAVPLILLPLLRTTIGSTWRFIPPWLELSSPATPANSLLLLEHAATPTLQKIMTAGNTKERKEEERVLPLLDITAAARRTPPVLPCSSRFFCIESFLLFCCCSLLLLAASTKRIAIAALGVVCRPQLSSAVTSNRSADVVGWWWWEEPQRSWDLCCFCRGNFNRRKKRLPLLVS